MSDSLLSVFDEYTNFKIDAKTLKEIVLLERNFVNNTERLAFLGGALIGTPKFRFLPMDKDVWFDDILKADEVSLKKNILRLPDIVEGRQVSTDEFNFSCLYVAYRIINSKENETLKRQALRSTLRYLHYKFLGSFMHRNFKHGANKEIAEATYAALSYKFELKKQGSWIKLIDYRIDFIVEKYTKKKKTLLTFSDDKEVLDMLVDTNRSLAQIVKYITRVFYEQIKINNRIKLKGTTQDFDGEVEIVALVRKSAQYKKYSHDVLVDKRTFIRPELVNIIVDIMHTTPRPQLELSLEWIVDNNTNRYKHSIEKLVDSVVLHAIRHIEDNRDQFGKGMNIQLLLSKIRTLYTSSRTTDQYILEMRKISRNIAREATKSKNESNLASIGTSICLYILLRTFSMDHYKNL